MGGLLALILLMFCLWRWRGPRNRKNNTTARPDLDEIVQVQPRPLPDLAANTIPFSGAVLHDATTRGSNQPLLYRPLSNSSTAAPPMQPLFEKGQHGLSVLSSSRPTSTVSPTAPLPAATSTADIQEIKDVHVVAHKGSGPEIDAPPSYAAAWSET